MILKDFIYKDIRRKPLVTILADLNSCSEQAIRLWGKNKSDLLTKYKNLKLLAEHYQCLIPDLFIDTQNSIETTQAKSIEEQSQNNETKNVY